MLQIVLSVWVKGLLLLILCKRDGRLGLSEVSLVMLNSDHIWVRHQRAFQGTSFGLASSVDGLLRIILNMASPTKASGGSGLCNQAVAVVDIIAGFESLKSKGLCRSILVKIWPLRALVNTTNVGLRVFMVNHLGPRLEHQVTLILHLVADLPSIENF